MVNNMNDIVIFFHLYYFDLCDEMLDALKLIPFSFNLYVNLVENQYDLELVKNKILNVFLMAHIIVSPNQGMDIGGQLRNMKEWINNDGKEEYIIFIHTKKNLEWRKELLSIIDPSKIPLIKSKYLNQKTGMIGVDKWNLNDKNSKYGLPIDFCDYYCEKFNLNNMMNKTFGFIGGTMFWVRSSIYRDFFINNDPLEIVKELEPYSNGGKIHALERILGYIVLDHGFLIEGI